MTSITQFIHKGINRNEDRDEDEVKDYRDERACKFFLTGGYNVCNVNFFLYLSPSLAILQTHTAGMCPNDIFVNTKMDEGPCQKDHSESLKEQFEKSKDIYMYDSVLERYSYV